MSVTSAPPQATPAAHGMPDNQRFRPLWTLKSRYQRKTLTALSVSPSGVWVAAASLDSNILFCDLRTGQLIGVFSFENQFSATALRWYSDRLLYAGCSNGRFLAIEYSPSDKPPLRMRPVPFKPFDASVTALALDPIHNILAVGHGGKTAIFSGGEDKWKHLDTVPEPCEGPHGTVTALGFSGDSLAHRSLFVGYAKAGFCMWNAEGDYHKTAYDAQGLVCSIGSAAFSSDGRFIVIATLDHSLVVYPMSQKGPVVHQRQLLPSNDQATRRPIIPIALAANNLVLRGSTNGKVPVLDLQSGPLSPLEHGPNEMIRALTTHGDKVFVGVSDAEGQSSQITCYLDRTSSLPGYARVQNSSDEPLFEIKIAELEKQNGLLARLSRSRLAQFLRHLYIQLLRRVKIWAELAYSRDTWIIMVVVWVFLVVLVVDPPEIPGPKLFAALTNRRPQTTSSQVSPQRPYSSTYGSSYGSQEQSQTARYPNLFTIVIFCVTYVLTRFLRWGCWIISLGLLMAGMVIGSAISVVALLPHAMKFVMTEVPEFLAAVICDALPEMQICPTVV